MRKKILAIMLCGILVLGMTGCGGSKSSGKNLKESDIVKDLNEVVRSEERRVGKECRL